MAKILGDGIDPHDIGFAWGLVADELKKKQNNELGEISDYSEHLEELEKLEAEVEEAKKERQAYEEKKTWMKDDLELRDRAYKKCPKYFKIVDEASEEELTHIVECAITIAMFRDDIYL